MVELVDAAGKLIDIGADQVGAGGLEGLLQGGAKLGHGEHQILGVVVGGLLNGQALPGTVAGEDALDPHDGIENVGAGVALEGGEALHIKVIILGGLVRKVAVFQGGHGDFGRGGLHLVVAHDPVLLHLGPDEVRHVRNQGFQPQHAAVSGLEGLAVTAVHGAEAHVLQLGGGGHDARLPGRPGNTCSKCRFCRLSVT